MTMSPQALAVGQFTSPSTGIGVSNTSCVNTADASTALAIAIGCSSAATGASETGEDFRLGDAGNPNNGATANSNTNPGGALYSTDTGQLTSSSTAIGSNSTASGVLSTALGSQAKAVGGNTIAIGVAAAATGNGSMAKGLQSAATGDFSQATGLVSSALGNSSTAIGHSSTAADYRSIAIGSTDTDASGIVYEGAEATEATADNAIAFGGGAKATAAQAQLPSV
ncbi:hypothetical protein [Psychrobacter aquimaris]|uniref:hypothetical protein n=1 Tax=Psychrobacter aquimaris TaxID=292733 RepID=UPI0039C6B5DA